MIKTQHPSNQPPVSTVASVADSTHEQSREDVKVQGKASRIDGLSLVTVHGVRFEWNDTYQSYWSIDGNPRELQRIDLASANGQLLKVQAGHVTHLRSAAWPAPFFVLSIMEWDGEVMLYHAPSLEDAQSYAAVGPGKHTILNADFTEFEPMEPEPTEREYVESSARVLRRN